LILSAHDVSVATLPGGFMPALSEMDKIHYLIIFQSFLAFSVVFITEWR